MSSIAAAQVDDIDDGIPDALVQGPAKALAAAADQEHARVTLGRAVKTLLHMLQVRGYSIVNVGGHNTRGLDPLGAAKEFDSPERATTAENEHEIIMEAEVVDPQPYTTAWAQRIPTGSKVLVIITTKGNVGVMREVLRTMEEHSTQHVILVSRYALTPYSKKWISECKGSTIEFFLLSHLQGAIDRHRLTPKHILLNAEMAERVRQRYKNATFPKLLITDPMVQFLGLTPGVLVMVNERMGREQAVVSFFEVSEM